MTFGVFAGHLALLSCFLHSYALGYGGGLLADSFTMLYDSKRVVRGQVPYRDFFNFTTPGTFWLQALAFRVFGSTFTVAQYVTVVALAGTCAGLFVLSYNLTRRVVLSLFPPLFLTCALVPHEPYPSHHWYAIATVTFTAVIAAWWLYRPVWARLVLLGVMCSVTFLFVQTDGVLVAAAVSVFLVLNGANGLDSGRNFLQRQIRVLFPFSTGLLAPLIGVVTYMALEGGLSSFVYDTLVWPRVHYTDVKSFNDVPFLLRVDWFLYWGTAPNTLHTFIERIRGYGDIWLTVWIIAIPILTWIAALWVSGRALASRVRKTRNDGRTPASRVQLLCSLISLAMLVAVFLGGDRDILHVMWGSVLTYPTFLGFVLPAGQSGAGDGPGVEDVAGAQWKTVFYSLMVVSLVWYWSLTSAAHGAGADATFHNDALNRYIRGHTCPRDTVLVLPYGGEAYFYSRPSASRYTLLWPGGIYNTRTQLQQVAQDFMSHPPKLVIFEKSFDGTRPTWSDYFRPNSRMMLFARAHYGAGSTGAAYVVRGRSLYDLGPYNVYSRR
ncbi:MAG: hypothetical protein NVSMB22_24490 [Chloroflexota bacterium]